MDKAAKIKLAVAVVILLVALIAILYNLGIVGGSSPAPNNEAEQSVPAKRLELTPPR